MRSPVRRDSNQPQLETKEEETTQSISYALRTPSWTGMRFGRELEPIALVYEGNRQEQHTKNDKTHYAISAIQLRHIVDENLPNGHRDQNQRLPANEGAAAHEA